MTQEDFPGYDPALSIKSTNRYTISHRAGICRGNPIHIVGPPAKANDSEIRIESWKGLIGLILEKYLAPNLEKVPLDEYTGPFIRCFVPSETIGSGIIDYLPPILDALKESPAYPTEFLGDSIFFELVEIWPRPDFPGSDPDAVGFRPGLEISIEKGPPGGFL